MAALLPLSAWRSTIRNSVIINTWDPLSVRIGSTILRSSGSVSERHQGGFPTRKATLTGKFGALKALVDDKRYRECKRTDLGDALPRGMHVDHIGVRIQVRSAFCAEGYQTGAASRYFNSPARLPFTQLGIRPTMAIAATSFERARN
jgi:hypothetical protein